MHLRHVRKKEERGKNALKPHPFIKFICCIKVQLRALLLPCPALCGCRAAPERQESRSCILGAFHRKAPNTENTDLRVTMLWTARSESHPRDKKHWHNELLLDINTLVGNPLARLPWMWKVLLKWSGKRYMAVFMRLYLLNRYLLPASHWLFSVLLHSSYYRKKV